MNRMEPVTFNPRHEIDPKIMYKVDIFLRRWKGIDGNAAFVSGGRYFVVQGSCLVKLMQQSLSFEEHDEHQQQVQYNKYKRNVCFETSLGNRQKIIDLYRKIFYQFPNAKTLPSFNALCARVRKDRYLHRQKFSYLVVKKLQCKNCQNTCVYDALKQFYMMDDKCVRQVNYLIKKESQINV
ncbi:late expression factor 2 [Phthorimaea operculella granulovirus]|uniref:Late expression factor 2 n=1 Tax=Phthorimaea operculella granulovirus TaxID=192584 RepID=Q8JS22_9BBAC|nr:late expression factor 2 [Phthorimaea operculella granulovirus]AAM70235.1 late expression factor 2 [Phthorimaea operculella granulovirus]ANY57426.1 late expression factor 2 [Phthorimaea operculella granulovirus]QBH65872.1 late expression factor 2 [Phthorimaea operculella granulovirus]QBH66002.1 late expression factor 2 [Phthorimaea operculella granulovirus]QBH66132.1 late expression factor 2 [Phthorimaea operculella granulovirus]